MSKIEEATSEPESRKEFIKVMKDQLNNLKTDAKKLELEHTSRMDSFVDLTSKTEQNFYAEVRKRISDILFGLVEDDWQEVQKIIKWCYNLLAHINYLITNKKYELSTTYFSILEITIDNISQN